MTTANTAAIALAGDAARKAALQAIYDDEHGIDGAFYCGPYTWVYLRVRGALNMAREDAHEEAR